MGIPTDRVVADRMLMVSEIEWLTLDAVAFIQAGETYWYDQATSSLVVEDEDGNRRSHPARWSGGPDARR